MKNLLLISLLLVSIIGVTQAQPGLKAGVTASQFYFGYDRDIDYKIGFTGGIYDRIYLSKYFSIQPELLYHSKGTLINYDPSEDRSRPRDQWRLNLGYITLPISLNLHLGNLSLGAGGYVAKLVHFNNNKWNYERPAAVYDVHMIKTTDYGFIFNTSYDCYGIIFQLNGTLGQPIIGKDGGVFSRIDVSTEYRHVYKNATLDFSILIPTKIHETKVSKKIVP